MSPPLVEFIPVRFAITTPFAGGRVVDVTDAEAAMLRALLAGPVASREVAYIFGFDNRNSAVTTLSVLRRKVEKLGLRITTGQGRAKEIRLERAQ